MPAATPWCCPDCGGGLTTPYTGPIHNGALIRQHRCKDCGANSYTIQQMLSKEQVQDCVGWSGRINAKRTAKPILRLPIGVLSNQDAEEFRFWVRNRHKIAPVMAALKKNTSETLRQRRGHKRKLAQIVSSVCSSCQFASEGKCSFDYPEAFTADAQDCVMYGAQAAA